MTIHHHQLNVHFLPRSIKGKDRCFPTALGRQSTFGNILDVWDLPFSHSDASISRKSCLVTILKAAVYPWECCNEFLVRECPSSHQPTEIREETLESRNLLSIGAATARVARVRTLPTFGILTWDPPKFCSKVLIHYTMDPTIFSTPAAPMLLSGS